LWSIRPRSALDEGLEAFKHAEQKGILFITQTSKLLKNREGKTVCVLHFLCFLCTLSMWRGTNPSKKRGRT